MAYSRVYTLDSSPSGDTVKAAMATKLDGDLTLAFTNLTSHEAMTTGAHGVGSGTIVGTALTQTLTNKTITTPTISGVATLSSATLSGGGTLVGTFTGGTLASCTLSGTVTASSATLSAPVITGGTSTNMTIVTPTLSGTITNTNGTLTGGTISGVTLTGTITGTGTTYIGGTVSGITLTGTITASGATLVSPTITGATFSSLTLSSPVISVGSDADGDIWYRSSGVVTRLGKGTDGQIIKQASSVPSWAWGGKVVQVVNSSTGALATGTTVMPADDTIPQNNEGDEYITLAITPKSATNYLIIDVKLQLSSSIAATGSMALFQDAAADALASAFCYFNQAPQRVAINHYMLAGGTSATTFKVRAGPASAGQMTLNGFTAGRWHGGVSNSSITIWEVAA